MTVREQVAAIMERRGITQAEIAQRLGLKRQHVHRLLVSEAQRETVPQSLHDVLEALDLELQVREKG